MPTSRQSAGTTSTNQYTPGQASSQQQGDINLSNSSSIVSNAAASALANAILGTTIAGSQVNAFEVWADCTVWDTTNNRALRPGIDFDVTLLHRSGSGC